MYRYLQHNLLDKTTDVVVLYGARQVGKTTLLKNTFPDARYINLESGQYTDILNSREVTRIKEVLENSGPKRLIILDEFQRLENPGLIAKLIHDEIPNVKLIITGSSSLEIAFKASESLAGRKQTKILFPLTLKEKLIQQRMIDYDGRNRMQFALGESGNFRSVILDCMRLGMYPELLNRIGAEESYLLEYADSVMLKDIFYLELVRNTSHLKALLKLLAYQIGQLVNVSDISSRIGISRQTVENYIDILKKTFVIYTLPPFTKKRRDEIGKTEKIYFYDLGIRNAIINDFSPVEYRVDFGNIFENFVISEILKLNMYYESHYGLYYWRTKWGSEVDLILDKDSKQKAFEIKINRGAVTKAFSDTYTQAETYVINLKNILSLLV